MSKTCSSEGEKLGKKKKQVVIHRAKIEEDGKGTCRWKDQLWSYINLILLKLEWWWKMPELKAIDYLNGMKIKVTRVGFDLKFWVDVCVLFWGLKKPFFKGEKSGRFHWVPLLTQHLKRDSHTHSGFSLKIFVPKNTDKLAAKLMQKIIDTS